MESDPNIHSASVSLTSVDPWMSCTCSTSMDMKLGGNMPIRFRRTLKVAPGVKLNFSKSGVSTTVGPKGFHFTFGKRGVRRSIGIPGTGISEVDYIKKDETEAEKEKEERREKRQESRPEDQRQAKDEQRSEGRTHSRRTRAAAR